MTTDRPIDLDALRLEDVRAGAFAGRPVTVLGLARSGTADLFAKQREAVGL